MNTTSVGGTIKLLTKRVTIIDPDTGDDIPLKFARVEWKDSEGILISLITWPTDAEDYIYGNRRCDVRIDDDQTDTYMIYLNVRFSFSDADIIRFCEHNIHSIPRAHPDSTDPIKAYALIKLV